MDIKYLPSKQTFQVQFFRLIRDSMSVQEVSLLRYIVFYSCYWQILVNFENNTTSCTILHDGVWYVFMKSRLTPIMSDLALPAVSCHFL